jgi:hypothetical protein
MLVQVSPNPSALLSSSNRKQPTRNLATKICGWRAGACRNCGKGNPHDRRMAKGKPHVAGARLSRKLQLSPTACRTWDNPSRI